MVTLADIFRQYGPAYRTAYQDELLPSHLRVMWCLENCRTEALGGHVYQCEACGEVVYSYHSCRNRHCNQCQDDKAQRWLAEQQALLLPVPYFLVTFTLPEELRRVAYGNQQVVYNLLFRTAAEALQALAADPRFVGGPGAHWARHHRDSSHRSAELTSKPGRVPCVFIPMCIFWCRRAGWIL